MWIAITSVSIIFVVSIIVIIYAFLVGFSAVNYTYFQDQILATVIKEQSITSNSAQDSYLLGSEGIALFKQKIINRLGFGPEFFALKEIIFTPGGDNFLIPSNANGLYYPATQQIILNTSPWISYFANNFESRSDYYDDISEFLFQVFYHEYGHHMANVYLLNLALNDPLASNSIYYNQKNNPQIEPWNNHFLQNFMSLLNYHSSQETNNFLYSDDNIKDFNGRPLTGSITYENQTKNDLPLKSIGSLYDSKTLFNKANGPMVDNYQEIIDGFNKNIGYMFAPKKTNFSPAPILNTVSLEFLSYLYCMQEILTRKYMQATFPYQTTKLIFDDGTYQFKLNDKSQRAATTYLLDTLNYQLGFDSDEDLKYLQDQPLKDSQTAQNMLNLWFNHVGQNQSSNGNNSADLSFIWNNNTATYYANSWGIQLNQADKTKVNQIKFGGFLSNDYAQKYKYVGYFKDEIFFPIEISIYDYTYNKVPFLGSSTRDSITQKFYVTNGLNNNEWIDGQSIQNNPIYFSSDHLGSNAKSLSSILNPLISPTWTKRFYLTEGLKKINVNYSAVLNNDNQVVISLQ